MTHSIAPDPRHEKWMDAALAQAAQASQYGDIPVGAVVVRPDPDAGGGGFELLAARRNEREATSDPTAHAEVLALRDAATASGQWRLDDCVLVVTLEPCPMCAGALWAARVGGVVFGAANDEAGALGSLYHLGQDPRLNHEFGVRGGVRAQQCADLLTDFFAGRRS